MVVTLVGDGDGSGELAMGWATFISGGPKGRPAVPELDAMIGSGSDEEQDGNISCRWLRLRGSEVIEILL